MEPKWNQNVLAKDEIIIYHVLKFENYKLYKTNIVIYIIPYKLNNVN